MIAASWRRFAGPVRAAVRADAGKIRPLQYARALAALLVVATHTLFEAEKLAPAGHPLEGAHVALPFGFGVDVFFVISGFVMAYISRGRAGRPGYAAEYLRARLTRVVPPYWFYTTLLALGLLAAPSLADSASLSWRSAAYSYLFFPGWSEPVRPLLSLGWTLNYEVFFYAAFFLALLACGRRAVAGTVAAFCALAGLWALADAGVAPPELPAAARFWFNPIILEFCLGAGVAVLYLRGARVPPAAGVALGFAAAAAVLVFQASRTDANRGLLFGVPAAAVVAALTLSGRRPGAAGEASDAAIPPPGGVAGRLSDAGVLLGGASYTLYLAHPFVLTAVYLVWRRAWPAGLAPGLSPWLYAAAAVVAAAAYSVVGYVFLERPLVAAANRLFPRRFDPRPPAARAAAPPPPVPPAHRRAR